MKIKSLALSLAMILVITLSACRSISVTCDPATATATKAKLNAMWEFFKDSVNWDVAKEMRGEMPTAGWSTWREYWMWSANRLKAQAENGRKHIGYIIEQRRSAGLPEIPELLER